MKGYTYVLSTILSITLQPLQVQDLFEVNYATDIAVIIQDVIKLMVMGNHFGSLEITSETLYSVMEVMGFFRETFVDTLEKL